MKQFETSDMASGGLALVLEPVADGVQFPELARKWAEILNAETVSAPVVTLDGCLLDVKIDGGEFWITYDIWQHGIHLEPKDKESNRIVLSLQKQLQRGL
ncbi:hypothetical protein [Polaromonas sp. SM01]|uniref:hypothetical protein n=1 Tax=Polaromonas sp. SM01 TaxID=3085630 RepID=UPI0029815436|nr:hypothetical protein [Polaromonas sp. SM01]MDW5441151.1 hypothetical protein [Polaromonas sp. SM01]